MMFYFRVLPLFRWFQVWVRVRPMEFQQVPSANLLAETGGIFCGLMREDDVHPTVLAPRFLQCLIQ